MTLKHFAEQVRETNPDVDSCYIAIMDSTETGTWHLEVETVPQAVIGGVYDTQIAVVRGREPMDARNCADRLQKFLEVLGFKVYTDREAWENSDDDV